MVGQNANGTPNGFKTNPIGIGTYLRLYPGFDGVSANGLRYGASAEIRENFGSGTAPAQSASAYSSTETLFVRRAFVYLANDKAGLLRLGQGDGVLGLFDNCIFTSQCYDGGIGNFNGGPLQGFPDGQLGGQFRSSGCRRPARNTATPRRSTCRRSSTASILACSTPRAWATRTRRMQPGERDVRERHLRQRSDPLV